MLGLVKKTHCPHKISPLGKFLNFPMTSPHLPRLYGTVVRNCFFITDHGGVAHLENARCTRLPVHYSTGSNPLQSAKASDLEALTLIPAASHSAAKHPSVHSRSQSKEANWNTSRAKHRDTILRPQYWTLTTPLLKKKTKNNTFLNSSQGTYLLVPCLNWESAIIPWIWKLTPIHFDKATANWTLV